MQLAIFDVDGTLTQSNRIDGVCYIRALSDEFGVVENRDWSAFEHQSDSGISAQVFTETRGRRPRHGELEPFQRRFMELLEQALCAEPASCAEIPGARVALQRLVAEPDWSVAIATGCWRTSAALKLTTAGFELEGIPAAYADDHEARHDIITTAMARAQQHYGCDGFSRVVYIGDGTWDVRTTRRLGMPFVGVARSPSRQAVLRREGAHTILADFADYAALKIALEHAAVPISI